MTSRKIRNSKLNGLEDEQTAAMKMSLRNPICNSYNQIKYLGTNFIDVIKYLYKNNLKIMIIVFKEDTPKNQISIIWNK